MIDYYCEMHGCKFIPLVSSIYVRARCRSYKRAPVYYHAQAQVEVNLLCPLIELLLKSFSTVSSSDPVEIFLPPCHRRDTT